MQEQELELQVGDTVRIGDYLVTVVDVDGSEVSVRIDPTEEPGEIRIEDGVVTMIR